MKSSFANESLVQELCRGAGDNKHTYGTNTFFTS